MIRHFENLWEEAEKTLKEYLDTEIDKKLYLSIFENLINADNKEEAEKIFGRALLILCYISEKYNINSWVALEQAITEFKIDMLEE